LKRLKKALRAIDPDSLWNRRPEERPMMTHAPRFGIMIAFILLLTSGGFATSAHAAEGAGSVWATVTSGHPGIGCTVKVSVEVRHNGDPVTGLAVDIALFDNGNAQLAQDAATTDDAGVAWLSFDTSGLAAGGSDWLDIDVDGAYSTGTSIVPTVGDCRDEPVELTAATSAISSAPAAADAPTDGAAAAAAVANFPTHVQDHSLSCEYAALEIATAAFGAPIPESASLASVPSTVDPHFGFRGDINGPVGGTDDYGVYAEPLLPVLAANGFTGNVTYGAEAASLEAALNAGEPTLVWISPRGDAGFYDENAYGDRFLLVPGEHVVVAYAYDDSGVNVSDPGAGQLEHLNWDWFLNAWSLLDGMALSVAPAG